MLSKAVYTPEEVAEILKLNKNTIYDLIKNGEIIAKKVGRVYRIPSSSISFVFSGLDYDLLGAEKKDIENVETIEKELSKARNSL